MIKVILFSPNGYVGSFMKKKLESCVDIETLEITRESNLNLIEGSYDILIYSASVTSARKATAEQYIRDNALCAINMMEFCKQHLVKRIIYISTDEIYGSLQCNQVTENTIMVLPNIYAVTKYLAERIIEESGINYYILRLPGIVGRRWGSSFVYQLMEKISRSEEVYLYNANKNFNNLVDIDDLVDFIWCLILKGGSDSQIFLLGNMNTIYLKELAEYIKNIYRSNSVIIDVGESGARYFTLDIAKAVEYGYRSKDIRVIIDDLYQYKMEAEQNEL